MTRIATWTITQYIRQITKLKATLSVKTCVSKILITITATGAASSAARPEAMRDPLSAGEGKVHSQANTDGETNIRKFGDSSKTFALRSEEEHEFDTVVKISQQPPRFPSQSGDLEPVHERLLIGFILAMQGSRGLQTSGDEPKCQNIKFITVRVATSESTDRTQRCIQYAGIAGLENMSLVKNALAE